MKFSAAVSLAIAPVALGKVIHNVYPVAKRDPANAAALAELGAIGGIGGGIALAPAAALISPGQITQVIVIWANPGGGAATQTINQQITVTQTVTAPGGAAPPVATSAAAGKAPPAAVAPPAAGATHTVMVGGAGGLAFTPSSIQAAMGDMVVFTFMSNNHTATQSAFATPCDPLAGGMDSGFQPNVNNTVVPAPQVAMQVMTTDPLWFYCKQTGHCGKGMTFSINPTAEKTQIMFQAMAIAQKGTGAGSAITGNATAPVAAPPAVAPAAGSSAASLAPLPALSTPVAGGAASLTGSTSGSVQTGVGQLLASGQCLCAVTCGTGSFPAVQAQGVGAFGGFAGALPASMMETTP